MLGPLGASAWNYQDDIVLTAPSFDEMMTLLHHFLSICDSWHAKLNAKKSDLFAPEVHYLGFIVGPHGYRVDPERVVAVSTMAVPRDRNTLLSFLGAINYLSAFIPRCAELASPLYDLTRNGVAFLWSPLCQKAFDSLRSALSDPCRLAHPDPRLAKRLRTDASISGLGGVLLQLRPSPHSPGSPPLMIEEPIAYVGRKLTSAESRYSTTELELLAVLFGLQKCRTMLASPGLSGTARK